MIAADGEGAETLIEVTVDEARDAAQAKRVAKSIVNSPLVKTAVHGADPNWGRVAMAVGKCSDDTDIDPDRVVIRFGATEVYPTQVGDDGLASLSDYLARRRGRDPRQPGDRRRRRHGVGLRPDRRLRPDQRRLHDLISLSDQSSRVSIRRPPAGRSAESNQPDTSTITSVGVNVDTHTSPEASTGTTTAFGSTTPADM